VLRWFGDPIGPYDVLIAEHAMAPNLMRRRDRGERDDGAMVEYSSEPEGIGAFSPRRSQPNKPAHRDRAAWVGM
jgi:hypothetical protein